MDASKISDRCKPAEIRKLDCEKCNKSADWMICRKCILDYLDATQRLEEIRRL